MVVISAVNITLCYTSNISQEGLDKNQAALRANKTV